MALSLEEGKIFLPFSSHILPVFATFLPVFLPFSPLENGWMDPLDLLLLLLVLVLAVSESRLSKGRSSICVIARAREMDLAAGDVVDHGHEGH